jgi:hypothetical protein
MTSATPRNALPSPARTNVEAKTSSAKAAAHKRHIRIAASEACIAHPGFGRKKTAIRRWRQDGSFQYRSLLPVCRAPASFATVSGRPVHLRNCEKRVSPLCVTSTEE